MSGETPSIMTSPVKNIPHTFKILHIHVYYTCRSVIINRIPHLSYILESW